MLRPFCGAHSLLSSFLVIPQKSKDRAQSFVDTGVAHTQASLDYVRSDPGLLGRVGLITVCGLGGVVLGFRGTFRSVLLPLVVRESETQF
jgi:hypothetical protein